MADDLIALDALGPTGAYHARKRLTVSDVAGQPLAELSLVPRLFITRTMAALRKARSLPAEMRHSALARAARMFRTESINGLSATEYEHTVSRVSGVPVRVVRAAADEIADAACQAPVSAYLAQPGGSVLDWRDTLTRSGHAVWTRRGHVVAVHAAGNHPAPHAQWLEALALGYRVAIRPSRREPFTPHRLVWALRMAGFGQDQVVLLPTSRDDAEDVVRGADLGVIYGGDDVVRRYANDASALVQGPGRSKILITAEMDWRQHLDVIVDSTTRHAGVACIEATAVFVEGDPRPLAHAIAERLATLPSLPPHDERAALPVQPLASAQTVERYLLAKAKGTAPVLGGDGIVDKLDDGSAVLRPAVHVLDRPDAVQAGIELPFPCVWVAPWSPADPISPLRNTLVLSALTNDDELVDALLEEPSISNVYRGDHPTHWLRPGVPHDGYLGEFLMRTKTMIRD